MLCHYAYLLFLVIQILVIFVISVLNRIESPVEIETKFEYFLRPNFTLSLNRYQVKDKLLNPKSVYMYSHGFRSKNLDEAEAYQIKNIIFGAQLVCSFGFR